MIPAIEKTLTSKELEDLKEWQENIKWPKNKPSALHPMYIKFSMHGIGLGIEVGLEGIPKSVKDITDYDSW